MPDIPFWGRLRRGTASSSIDDDLLNTTIARVTQLSDAAMAERVRDWIAAALANGASVTITPDDNANTITVAVNAASTTATGAVELADTSEATTATDATRAMTPATAKAQFLALLAAAVTGNTETGIAVTYANEKLNFVVSSSPAPQSHTRYAAISADTTFDPGEFTSGTTGASSTTDTIVLPTWTGDRYIAFAVPDTANDLTNIAPNGGFNEISEFQRIAGTITINSVAYKVWRTTEIGLPANSGTTWHIS